MKRFFLSITALLILLAGCRLTTPQSDSIKNAKQVILKEDGHDLFLYWELKNEKSLWESDLGEVNGLLEYRDSLKAALGDTLFEQAVQKESVRDLDPSLLENVEDGDRINALLVHTGAVGMIREIDYLEAQILNYQAERFPLFSQPTEFHGFIAKHDEDERIRVYFGASNTEWPPRPTVLIEELTKAFDNGWRLTMHLHNHFCKKEDNYVGILAPSLADAQYFKMLKERFNIERALITNGFHTVELSPVDFAAFESH